MPMSSPLTSSPLPTRPDCPQVLLTPWDSRLLGVPPPSHWCWLGLPFTHCGHCSPAPHCKLCLLIPKPDLLTAQHLADKSCHRPRDLALVTSLLTLSPHMKVQASQNTLSSHHTCPSSQPLHSYLTLEAPLSITSRKPSLIYSPTALGSSLAFHSLFFLPRGLLAQCGKSLSVYHRELHQGWGNQWPHTRGSVTGH